jgi:hypothetical protein
MLETVVIDVEGLEADDGTPMKYTRELGEKLLLDPDYRVFMRRRGLCRLGRRERRRSTRRSRQKTDRRPDLAAGLGRQDRRHRAGSDRGGHPLDLLPCVASRVDLFPHLVFEAHAFRELSTDRPVGFDRGAIPWRSIDAFAGRYGLVGDDFDRLAASSARWMPPISPT